MPVNFPFHRFVENLHKIKEMTGILPPFSETNYCFNGVAKVKLKVCEWEIVKSCGAGSGASRYSILRTRTAQTTRTKYRINTGCELSSPVPPFSAPFFELSFCLQFESYHGKVVGWSLPNSHACGTPHQLSKVTYVDDNPFLTPPW